MAMLSLMNIMFSAYVGTLSDCHFIGSARKHMALKEEEEAKAKSLSWEGGVAVPSELGSACPEAGRPHRESRHHREFQEGRKQTTR